MVAAHLAGTRYGIRVDPADGLLTQGADGYALTWMDARVDGVPVTPRIGKPVEINALWVNALAGARRAARAARARRRRRDGLARTGEGQLPRTGSPRPAGWLTTSSTGPAATTPRCGPNQLLAWSLPYAPLRPEPGRCCERSAAAPADAARAAQPRAGRAAATGRAPGDRRERDRAYHQGTVWPWLIGPYVDAARATSGCRPIGRCSTGIDAHLAECGLGSVSETADGDRAARRHRLPVPGVVGGGDAARSPNVGVTFTAQK